MEFLATLIEQSHEQHRIWLQSKGAKKSELPASLNIERPGEEKPKKKIVSDPTEIAAFLNKAGGG